MTELCQSNVHKLADLFEEEMACCLVDRDDFEASLFRQLSQSLPKRTAVRENQALITKLHNQLKSAVETYEEIPLYPKAAHALTLAFGPFEPKPQPNPLALMRETLHRLVAVAADAEAKLQRLEPEPKRPIAMGDAVVMLILLEFYQFVMHEPARPSGGFLAWSAATLNIMDPRPWTSPTNEKKRVQRAYSRAQELAAELDEWQYQAGDKKPDSVTG